MPQPVSVADEQGDQQPFKTTFLYLRLLLLCVVDAFNGSLACPSVLLEIGIGLYQFVSNNGSDKLNKRLNDTEPASAFAIVSRTTITSAMSLHSSYVRGKLNMPITRGNTNILSRN